MVQTIVTSGLLFSSICFAQGGNTIDFSSGAQLHRVLKKPIAGTLLLDDIAVEFRSPKFSYRWPYGEIKTFDLSGSRELVITGYENRHWHEPGERRFHFTLAQPIPSRIAAEFTVRV